MSLPSPISPQFAPGGSVAAKNTDPTPTLGPKKQHINFHTKISALNNPIKPHALDASTLISASLSPLLETAIF
ncbi:hypothetical protein L1987_30405 [Smallanthus sonchifolius]|uniref:Uncharacterized protein n=1 Tax=Smallanthus sonchifolius TaxID=185202 RepID=A0ACB9I2Q8_9ASTR|nr:hypothetical protein L1987_30405 [Smallanthus sonchifolius]